MVSRILVALSGLMIMAGSGAQATDLEAAKQQFVTSCGICHTVDKTLPPRQGPMLAGIVGRKAGTLEGFKYSPALAAVDWVWDEANLDPWIENAKQVLPATNMVYKQADPDKRKLIIEYLKSLSQAN